MGWRQGVVFSVCFGFWLGALGMGIIRGNVGAEVVCEARHFIGRERFEKSKELNAHPLKKYYTRRRRGDEPWQQEIYSRGI